MKITATDADEEGNKNSQIAYSIISQNPSNDMFYMTNDGTVYVKNSGLDREVRTHTHTLTHTQGKCQFCQTEIFHSID